RDMINKYTTINPTDNSMERHIPEGDIYTAGFTGLLTHNGRIHATYEREIGVGHRVNALAGMEMRSLATGTVQTGEYGFDRERLLYQYVDYINPVRHLLYGSNQYIPYLGNYRSLQNNFISQFGNIAYSYDGRYTVSASARSDASNQFGLHTNDKWNPLWSVGASWRISEEPFWHFSQLSLLKIRATF